MFISIERKISAIINSVITPPKIHKNVSSANMGKTIPNITINNKNEIKNLKIIINKSFFMFPPGIFK